MILVETARDLWRVLDTRGRALALVLIGFLALSGAFEIVSVMVLFGYISLLGETAMSGAGGGRLAIAGELFRAVAGDVTGPDFALRGGAVLVAVFLIKNLMWFLASFALIRFAMKRYTKVASALFNGYQNMPLEKLRQKGSGDPAQVLSSTLAVFRGAFAPLLQASADVAVVVAMLGALMILIDPVLVVVAGVVIGFVAVIFLGATRRMAEGLGERVTVAQRSLSGVVNEALRGMIDVRLAARQGMMRERFDHTSGEFSLADRRMRALTMGPRILNEIVLAIGIVLAAAYFTASEEGIANALPALAVLGFAGLRVTAAMSRMTMQMQRIRQFADPRRRLMKAIADVAPQLLSDAAQPSVAAGFDRGAPLPAGAPAPLSNALVAENVSFSYPKSDRPAIDSIDLKIEPGTFHAFCGPSGGGKSTLSLVLIGLLKPSSGLVKCDGWDIQDHLGVWHDQIGFVGQLPFILPGTVRENIAIGLESSAIDDDAVWAALEAASVADVFRKHPQELNARLGEDGGLLSGGQRQRVAIARALYRDPAVLVLDEATAALDTATEREITASIGRLQGQRTILAIAHRLSTIERADVIHVIEAGRIVASGSYSELYETNATFRDLATPQQ